VALEPIRQVNNDGKRERIAATALAEYFTGWKMIRYSPLLFHRLSYLPTMGQRQRELHRRFRNQMA
jgi:hypothetical protein